MMPRETAVTEALGNLALARKHHDVTQQHQYQYRQRPVEP